MAEPQFADVTHRSQRFYEEHIRGRIKESQWGQYVTIEPDSGDYCLATTRHESRSAARQVHPDKVMYTCRIGVEAVPQPVGCTFIRVSPIELVHCEILGPEDVWPDHVVLGTWDSVATCGKR